MKEIDFYYLPNLLELPSARAAAAASNSLDLSSIQTLDDLYSMYVLPPPDKPSVLEDPEVFGVPDETMDYCDNDAQAQVLRHHYLNEFGHRGDYTGDSGKEILKDYSENAVIHEVVDDVPSTYRGRKGAVMAWQDLVTHLSGNCHFDLTHISVRKNHAQVFWKAVEDGPHHVTLHGTDSFEFDNTNHIKMQTTVALTEKD